MTGSCGWKLRCLWAYGVAVSVCCEFVVCLDGFGLVAWVWMISGFPLVV